MRWTDRSADVSLQSGDPAAEAEGTSDAEVIAAALATHRTALRAVEDAHLHAGQHWQDERWSPVAGVTETAADFHRSRRAAHQQRREFLEQLRSFSPRALTGLSPDDFSGLQAPAAQEKGAALPAGRMLTEALRASAGLPDGEHGISRPPLPLRLGVVTASDWELAFADVAEEAVRITAENWREHVAQVDLLLLPAEQQSFPAIPSQEPSAAPDRKQLAQEIIPAFRAAGTAVVLFNTSGLQIKYTLEVARESSCVITLDERITSAYRKHLGEDHPLHTLRHPVSPLRHTPVGTRPGRSPAVCLVEAGRPRKAPHLERAQHLPALLDGVLASGRPAALLPPRHSQQPGREDWGIPPRYTPWTITRERLGLYLQELDAGQDPEIALAKLQRSLDIGLAVQPVQNYQGIFDPQVLQLMASGTMVLTTYNQGINSHYPQAYIANSAEDVAKTLQTLSETELRQVQNDGVRAVFTSHHAADLLAEVARFCGLDVPPPAEERVVAVAPAVTEELRREISEQTHAQVRLLSWEELASQEEDVLTDIDVLVPVSPQRHYTPTYIADHVAAFRYQGAPVTVKLDGDPASVADQGYQHAPVTEDGLDLSLSAWWRPAAAAMRSPEALRAHLQEGVPRIYRLDRTGHHPAATSRPESSRAPAATAGRPSFLEVIRGESAQNPAEAQRRPIPPAGIPGDPAPAPTGRLRRPLPDPQTGTDPEAAEREFRATAEELGLELAVVVPIYNNGHHLRHKAFASLRRSCMFERMHILLINDGSTDAATTEIIEELAHAWPNVSAFHHPRGGSGSASRPRNTGLDLSFTPYVTYLDPDDEELEDGYWELMEKLEAEPEAEFALGTMAMWTHDFSVLDYHSWYHGTIPYREGLFRPEPHTLADIDFRPASIESIVARTDWLKSLGLVQPVGAVGQDTYFFQQMLYYTTAYAAVYRPVYTYYGAVETSIVNVVSPKYFRKYLILETDRASWLEEVGLMEAYKEHRFEHFFSTWYMAKLKRVPEDQHEEAAEVLREIVAQYGEVHWSSWKNRRFAEGHRELADAEDRGNPDD